MFQAIALVFKLKIVASVIILSCNNKFDNAKLVRNLNSFNIPATVLCDVDTLKEFIYTNHRLQGILYMTTTYEELKMVRSELFSNWYKWIIISENIPERLNKGRYDADIVYINGTFLNNIESANKVEIRDVYVQPNREVSIHAWAQFTSREGLVVVHEKERMIRRFNLLHSSIRIATPLGLYSNDTYDGSFLDYLKDMSMPERDSGVRCAFTTSSLITERLNATAVLVPTKLWSTEVSNDSMLLKLHYGSADLSGGVLRIMPSRFEKLDYAMNIWPFRVGFTYLAERESSSNMFVTPFTPAIWWCCIALLPILMLAQRCTAKTDLEKEGAFIAVLATCLQQDASAVPQGISGRWTFLVLSISAMLIHAYYTSAIVSALMSTGRSGPDSLKSLGDSRYSIASEDYDYMRYLMFDVPTNWYDLEYLKRKKLSPTFYQDIRTGVKMIQSGQTAYHTEYNQLFPYLKVFTDDQLCKLQYIDTVPESLTWITTTKRGQWTEIFKSSGAWLRETGLAKQLVSQLRSRPPPCRAALLAERVNFYDIAPIFGITLVTTILSIVILGFEILIVKFNSKSKLTVSYVK